jgi:phosphate transport system ATP-binding protein
LENILETHEFDFWYPNGFYANKKINTQFRKNQVSALIGPSGCGKSTFLKSMNRLNDELGGVKVSGDVLFDGENIYDSKIDIVRLRQRIGMVFQQPNPFPSMSVYQNVIAGVKLNKLAPKNEWDKIVESSLKKAALWDEVKDALHQDAHSLSGGQQQRLCIARAIAPRPDIILMDEPTSALDPIATEKIESLIQDLGREFSVIIVTHNMQQAKRISHQTSFFVLGEMLEQNDTKSFFSNPQHPKAEEYISGVFG